MKFTSLTHLLNEEALKRCHYELPNRESNGNKWDNEGAIYEENLDGKHTGFSKTIKAEELPPCASKKNVHR